MKGNSVGWNNKSQKAPMAKYGERATTKPQHNFTFAKYNESQQNSVSVDIDSSDLKKVGFRRKRNNSLDKFEKMAEELTQDDTNTGKSKRFTAPKMGSLVPSKGWFNGKNKSINSDKEKEAAEVIPIDDESEDQNNADDDQNESDSCNDDDNNNEMKEKKKKDSPGEEYTFEIPEPDEESPSKDDAGESPEEEDNDNINKLPNNGREKKKKAKSLFEEEDFYSSYGNNRPAYHKESQLDFSNGFCTLIMVALIPFFIGCGVTLLNYHNYQTSEELAGAIILWLVATVTVVGLFVTGCCGISFSRSEQPKFFNEPEPFHGGRRRFGHLGADFKDPAQRWKFVRINDRYNDSRDKDMLQKKTIAKLPEEYQTLLSDYIQQEKDREEKEREEMNQDMGARLKEAINKKLSVKQVMSRVKPCVFKIEFNADSVEALREKISWVISIGTCYDEVVIVLMSPGGGVAHYGYAAAQLKRIRVAGMKLTICVDHIAASGGYMMACIGDEICAAPFSYIGSIGVVAVLQNYEQALNNFGVYSHVFTAGKYKRTVTPIGEISDEGKEKFKQDLEAIHKAFKEHVSTERGNKLKLDIDEIATGEDWLAVDAFKYGLVDRICTSDELLIEKKKEFEILELVANPTMMPPFDPYDMKLSQLGEALFSNKERFDQVWEKVKSTIKKEILGGMRKRAQRQERLEAMPLDQRV